MNDALYVWIYLPGQPAPVPCGRLSLLRGRVCLFDYDERYLSSKGAFALSPDLPLQKGTFEPPTGQELHPVFEDAGPDRWGRQVIDKVFQPRRRSPIDYLALAGEDRIGALGFSASPDEYVTAQEEAFHAADLPDLVSAARAVECKMPIDERLRRLLQPGASAGGARPKAIIEHDGRKWIAKFPSADDEAEVCAIEHASLRLASECGIDVPESRLVPVQGRRVLLVERFDREPGGARVHFASARTVLMAQGLEEQNMAYADMADFARQQSSQPKHDCLQLFRRMAFNVLMENTDDHGKNHAFLYRSGRWDLASAYDIQPQFQAIPYQQLVIGREGYEPTISNVLSSAGRFMLDAGEAQREIERLLEVLSAWRRVFADEGVGEADIELCSRFVLAERMLVAPAPASAAAGRKSKRSASPTP